MSARRVSRRQPQRGAVPAVDPRIRNEVGAIALLAFALLSIVALIADQGPVLQWWHAFLVSGLGWRPGGAVPPRRARGRYVVRSHAAHRDHPDHRWGAGLRRAH